MRQVFLASDKDAHFLGKVKTSSTRACAGCSIPARFAPLCGRTGNWLPVLSSFLAGSLFYSTAIAETTAELNNDYGAGDTATLHMESAWSGVLTYDNSENRASQTGSWPISDGGVTCHISVTVGDDEIVTVHCEGQYAPHVEVQGIPDGQTFDFLILYLGG